MKKKIFVAFIALGFVLSVIGLAFADDKASTKAKQSSQLVALLPASEGIVAVDVKRLVGEALPQILSANKPKLDEILVKLDELKTKTGIDLTRFDQVAIGVKTKRISAKTFEVEPVVLARGSYDVGSLLAIAKFASKGKYREETVGNRTIYIFSAKDIAKDNKPKPTGTLIDSVFDKMFDSMATEFALTSYDPGTIAFGTVARVRETIESKTRVSTQLLDLVFRNQNAVMSFGANMPKNMSGFFGLDNPEIDKNIDLIQQLYGTMNVDGSNTTVAITAKTLRGKDAEELASFLQGIAEVGKILIGSSKGADKKVYAGMIENAKISHLNNEVSLDVHVTQNELDVLLGEKK